VKLSIVELRIGSSLRFKAVLFDMFDTLMMIEKDHAFYSPALHSAYEFLAANGIYEGFDEFERLTLMQGMRYMSKQTPILRNHILTYELLPR